MDRSLVGYSPWGHKESDTTYRVQNNNEVMGYPSHLYPLLAYSQLNMQRNPVRASLRMGENICTRI